LNFPQSIIVLFSNRRFVNCFCHKQDFTLQIANRDAIFNFENITNLS